ncbi:hypothetical protein AOLI_G00314030 [Acnodon oligacanthus]
MWVQSCRQSGGPRSSFLLGVVRKMAFEKAPCPTANCWDWSVIRLFKGAPLKWKSGGTEARDHNTDSQHHSTALAGIPAATRGTEVHADDISKSFGHTYSAIVLLLPRWED